MTAVNTAQRRLLETTVGHARDAAEAAASAELKRLAVDADSPFASMSPENRTLRNQLRAESRRLGGFAALVTEVAYQHWHRMLFARFLAENFLLMYDGPGTAVSLADCDELADEQNKADEKQTGIDSKLNRWDIAARCAAGMLPGVFRLADPVLQVRFATEGRQALEKLLANLPPPIFRADDSLGWVYQFWQAKAKAEVNASGRKVGGADISPVTQLFTEHYMVQFLLHNSLGAWWAGKHPSEPLPTEDSYLRRLDDFDTPAAGTFPGWPSTARELRILDPSCGSGHFLVAAFALMVRFRMREEDLTITEAGDAVLRDNLFGLELDPRCTQIAAFALALTAWKHGGYRELPLPNVACSGTRLGGTADDWRKLAGRDGKLGAVLVQLRDLFANAPDLGSLIDPTTVGLQSRRAVGSGGASAKASPAQVSLLVVAPAEREYAGEPLVELDRVLSSLTEAAERFGEEGEGDAPIFGEAAKEAVRAVKLLSEKYHLVITNVPYLGRGNQDKVLREFCEREYARAKADLATVFVERCLQFCTPGGSTALVTPQNWLFLGSYASLRGYLLRQKTWNVVAKLGENGFESPQAAGAFVGMFVLTNAGPQTGQAFAGLDVSAPRSAREKDEFLRTSAVTMVGQAGQLGNPDSRVALDESVRGELLSSYATSYQGICTGDYARFGRVFWEMPNVQDDWILQTTPVSHNCSYGGCENILLWQNGRGNLHKYLTARLGAGGLGAWIRGTEAWGKRGIAVAQMRLLPVALYTGMSFDNNGAVIIPKVDNHVSAIFTFCSSPEFHTAVRRIDQALKVTNQTLVKVPFDLAHWQAVADEKYPDGLPEPHSDDPTQWLFDGHPAHATAQQGQPGDALHVAVARLLGYRWPRQTGAEIPGCHLLPDDGLGAHADADGIVCLPPVAGEPAAAERLRALLVAAFVDNTSADSALSADETHAALERLLADVGYGGKSLDEWLRDGFFAQHLKRFHNRPFLWHVWDGRKDGFSAIVNYHTLDRAKLEKLTFTYLGDWINRQSADDRDGVAGANGRLVEAQKLQTKLAAILDGEPPFDIYVRWKPLAEQPIGWEPDLNDGVRMNIRPFVEAEVLRVKKPNIKWGKDRGTNPDGSERHNDLHYTLAEKRAARAAVNL
jgi:hypothetical protein